MAKIIKNHPVLSDGFPVIPKAKNSALKVDETTPAYAWSDLEGLRVTNTSGINSPTREEYKTGVFDLGYNASDIQDWAFHLKHSEVIGGNKYIHSHVRQNGTSVTGNLVLTCVITLNYGHNRTGSPAPITKTVTVTPAQLPQYQTNIQDILFMQSGGGAGLFDSDLILPDDDIMVTMTVTTAPTITGGLSAKVFIPFLDIHREVTNIQGTKNKSPDFWA
jgi:hypothetical protein